MTYADKYSTNPLILYRNQQPRTSISTSDIWHSTYCGIPAIQAWQDFMLWEEFLNISDPKAIIELGTFLGGFSLYLYHQAYSREALFYTVDIAEHADLDTENSPLWINGLFAAFLMEDVFSPVFENVLRTILADERNHPLVLFCDGGNKPKEMQIFAPMLYPGDYIVTHDWGNEISWPDLDSIKDFLDPVLLKECEELHSLTRFFKRK